LSSLRSSRLVFSLKGCGAIDPKLTIDLDCPL
jgi:hypothetical protein